MKNNRESANQFIDGLLTQIRVIDGIRLTDIPELAPLYKQILSVALLDTMAKTVFPQVSNNRERFVTFLKEFSNWTDGGRVSLPHLVQLISRVSDPGFSALRERASVELDKWGEGELIQIKRDLSYNEVADLWPGPKEALSPIQGIKPEFIQHWHLIYTYRNALVHEFRTLGKGIDLAKNDAPYYHSLTDLDDTQFTWELVYPTFFFQVLCRTCVMKLKDYLTERGLDPFEVFDFGTYWLTKLN